MGARKLTIDMDATVEHHKKAVQGMTCIAIFNIDEAILDKERTFQGGSKTTFWKSLIRKLGAIAMEHKEDTETMGKFFILISREISEAARHWVKKISGIIMKHLQK